MPTADDFLNSTRSKRIAGGARCFSCLHPEADALNEDLRTYVERRALPKNDSQHVSGDVMPWLAYFRLYLRVRYDGLPVDETSLRRHANLHLDLEIPL